MYGILFNDVLDLIARHGPHNGRVVPYHLLLVDHLQMLRNHIRHLRVLAQN